MDQPRPPAFALSQMPAMVPPMMPQIPMMSMMPSVSAAKMATDTAAPRSGQNVVFCYNPLMMQSPMRMFMPVMAPPMMMPMMPMAPPPAPQLQQPLQKLPTPPMPENDYSTPLDLSTKSKKYEMEIKKEDVKPADNKDLLYSPNSIKTEYAGLSIKTENGFPVPMKPSYKKNILKRYGECLQPICRCHRFNLANFLMRFVSSEPV